MTPEGRVKAAVKRMREHLEQETGEPVYSFMPVQNGMGAPALDFYWCFHGRFFAIETKAPGKTLTARQKETRKQIERAGGIVFVAEDQADVEQIKNSLKILAVQLDCDAWPDEPVL